MAKLSAAQFLEAEFTRHVFTATPDESVKREDLLDSKFWANVSFRMTPSSRIEVIPVDGTYFAELLVRDCGPWGAKVAELRFVELDKVTVGEAVAGAAKRSLQPQWRGPIAKWCVMDTTDNQVMAKEFTQKADAEQWIRDNARSFAS